MAGVGFPQLMMTPGKYRLRGGYVGTYLEACLECLSVWNSKRELAEIQIKHFEDEIKKERNRKPNDVS